MQLAYPIVHVLFYIAMLFAPEDVDHISITGPQLSFELTREGSGWKFTSNEASGTAAIKDGKVELAGEGKSDALSVVDLVAVAIGHDWSKQTKVTLQEGKSLEKSDSGFVFRLDEGKPGMRIYQITWRRGGNSSAVSRSVNVLGAVKTPGSYSLAGHATLLDALSAAGGPTEAADPAKSVVLRGPAGERATVLPNDISAILSGESANPEMLDHDTLLVPIRSNAGKSEALDGTTDDEAVVEIAADGELKLNGEPVSSERLLSALKELAIGSELRVSVAAGPQTPYDKIVKVLDICRAAGIRNLTIEQDP